MVHSGCIIIGLRFLKFYIFCQIIQPRSYANSQEASGQLSLWTTDAFNAVFRDSKTPSPHVISQEGPEFEWGETPLVVLDALKDAIIQQTGVAVGHEDVFVDLGSGHGLCVWYASLAWGVQQSIGLELSVERHAAAKHLVSVAVAKDVVIRDSSSLAILPVLGGGQLNRAVAFYGVDFHRDFNLWCNASIIYVYIRGLSDTTRVSLVAQLQKLKPGTIVASQERLFGCHASLTQLTHIEMPEDIFPQTYFVYMISHEHVGTTPTFFVDTFLRQITDPNATVAAIDANNSNLHDLNEPCAPILAPSESLPYSASTRLYNVFHQRGGAPANICSIGWQRRPYELLQLVQQMGDAPTRWDCLLDTLYWNTRGRSVGNVVPSRELRHLRSIDSFRDTYGEIELQGIRQLIIRINHTLTSADEVIDLGSGAGKLLLQLLLETPVGLVHGVELSETRHKLAVSAFARLVGNYTLVDNFNEFQGSFHGRKFHLQRADLFQANISKAVLVYSNTQAFSSAMLFLLGAKLERELADHAIAVLFGHSLEETCHALVLQEIQVLPGNARVGRAHFYRRRLFGVERPKPNAACETHRAAASKLSSNDHLEL